MAEHPPPPGPAEPPAGARGCSGAGAAPDAGDAPSTGAGANPAADPMPDASLGSPAATGREQRDEPPSAKGLPAADQSAPAGASALPAADQKSTPGGAPGSASSGSTSSGSTSSGTAAPPPGPAASAGASIPSGEPQPRSQEADDAAFLELVARFDDEPATRAWPEQEDVAGPRRPTIIILRPPFGPGTAPEPEDHTDPGPTEPTLPPGLRPHDLRGDDSDEIVVIDLAATGDGSGAAAHEPSEDEHYVPPAPPPLPRMRPVTRWALGSIALGMVFLVVPTLIGFSQSRSQDVAGVLLVLGGVGTLVARMGERPPTDLDGPDDGAVL
ncbi:Integral membrane protein [Frankia sp. AiPs1]|uniref:hypothetical protein n=1 Tax=Frankia sp. AiPa1 TaxID=573492 RepID=UPI00202B97AD|nr:hypothetical protein [Frankia sp. AiPa1]MCL9762348.1 hypothetical protein [Frankia sp. AiPa1]